MAGIKAPIQLGNNGLSFQVKGDSGHRGYIEINRGYIDWYAGKTTKKPTGRLHINDFIAMFEDE